jgi:ABC-2 type transport system permease protein
VLLLLGRLFLAQMNFFLGVLTIKYQDIWLFLMIKNNVQAFLAGALVPLTLMPDAVLKALRLTPFYHATHLPAMLLLGRNSNEALTGMLVLILWIAIFMALNKYAYTHLRTRYDGVGI